MMARMWTQSHSYLCSILSFMTSELCNLALGQFLWETDSEIEYFIQEVCWECAWDQYGYRCPK